MLRPVNNAVVNEVLEPLRLGGRVAYLGEPVSVSDHLLQTATIAQAEGSDAPLVVACLLHDLGWLIGSGGAGHETRAALFLSEFFDRSVTEPIRLHVTAKQYLCTIDPDYYETLTLASRRTLHSQGGFLDAHGTAGFEAERYALDAVCLRRFDDRAKDPGAITPELDHFVPMLESLIGV
ncbi:MAG TPA: HD domain-containing protein [Acidimicrobiales bacterium]|nr:HD domain-containing protein [Acidimicrobiales bacterium]